MIVIDVSFKRDERGQNIAFVSCGVEHASTVFKVPADQFETLREAGFIYTKLSQLLPLDTLRMSVFSFNQILPSSLEGIEFSQEIYKFHCHILAKQLKIICLLHSTLQHQTPVSESFYPILPSL